MTKAKAFHSLGKYAAAVWWKVSTCSRPQTESRPNSVAINSATRAAISIAARAFRKSARVLRASTSSTVRAISSRTARSTSPAVYGSASCSNSDSASSPDSKILRFCRDAWPVRQVRQRGRLIHAVLRHVAIGGPFAAADGDQAGIFDADDMIARERRRVGGAVRFHQRADAGEHAENIGARGLLGQIERGGVKDELDFLLHGHRFERRRR